jgi:TonB family protein
MALASLRRGMGCLPLEARSLERPTTAGVAAGSACDYGDGHADGDDFPCTYPFTFRVGVVRLLIAFAVSLAVHVALGAVSLVRPAPAIALPPPAQIATRVALFDVIDTSPQPSPPSPAAAAPAARSSRPTPHPVAPAENGEVPDTAPASEEAAPEPSGPAEVAAQGPAAAAAAKTFDVTSLHAALAESARRCYPAAAKRYHLTGEAQVDFCLDAVGALTSLKLSKPTGQDLLDAAARECVVASAMPLPSEAAGGCFTVPVRFGR